MLIFDDTQIILRKFCQDSSTAGIDFQNLLMNHGYKEVLTTLNRQVTERTLQTTVTPDERGYQVPPDCVWPKDVTLIDGTTRDALTEEPSDRKWNEIKSHQQSGRPSMFHYSPRFGIGGGVLEFDPIPSSDDYLLELIYEATEKDLGVAKVTQGEVSLINGSADVTGNGTNWSRDMENRYFKLGGADGQRIWYRVKQVLSATSLSLEQYYHGNDVTNQPYTIAEIFALPEDCHLLPLYYSAREWWATKGNSGKSADFGAKYTAGLTLAKKNHAVTTRNNLVGQDLPPMPFPEYPDNYPTSIS